jgi:hypothetical protein
MYNVSIVLRTGMYSLYFLLMLTMSNDADLRHGMITCPSNAVAKVVLLLHSSWIKERREASIVSYGNRRELVKVQRTKATYIRVKLLAHE